MYYHVVFHLYFKSNLRRMHYTCTELLNKFFLLINYFNIINIIKHVLLCWTSFILLNLYYEFQMLFFSSYKINSQIQIPYKTIYWREKYLAIWLREAFGGFYYGE